MKNREYYTGIDCFRFIAALLVVAIHTSPLESFSETGDFILTRVLARVAVPFFFMASGFFLMGRYVYHHDKLIQFLKKTAWVYGAAILVYIPVNVYNHSFSGENFLPEMVKDILFDGTLYHLWYLPAAMIGAAIAWGLMRKLDYPGALAVGILLYMIGLFGDSYYGIAAQFPWAMGFYDQIFQVSDYTRNGVFFAPIFFILGGWMAQGRRECSDGSSFREPGLQRGQEVQGGMLSVGKIIWGFGVSFALMLAEALALRGFGLQRHDSMYVFLLPCMFFLFQLILRIRGQRLAWLRDASLLIYLIHPMMILAVRLLAKAFRIEAALLDNSMLHYLAVCLLSVACGVAGAVLLQHFPFLGKQRCSRTDRAYLEIHLGNLAHNASVLQKAMPPGCKLMAVVKAEAYGHGAFVVCTNLEKMGVSAFAVATIDEGIALRKYGIRGEILILGYTDVRRARELKKYVLMQTLIDFPYALALNRQGVPVEAHIKIDTGMHRLGIPAEDIEAVKKVFAMGNIRVRGMYSHLCCADSRRPEDVSFTMGQIGRFYGLAAALKERGIRLPKLHIQSSYGLLNYPELACDYVRVGIGLYGVLSRPGDQTAQTLDLRPVLSLKTRVVLIRTVREGEDLGYGRCFTAWRDSKIAILPIGYGDGVPRALSCGVGSVVINRRRAPIAGRICMDQMAVDITDAGDVRVGDTVTLIGGELPAPAVAQEAGTISNELLCRMGARLPVVAREG